MAAQAHCAKQDRAVVISARNFIRALGGSAGLAIASAIFSNTLLSSLPQTLPEKILMQIRDSIFDMPVLGQLELEQQYEVRDSYVKAARSVFYLWAGAMGCCLALMVFVKDKGLNRHDENKDVRSDELKQSSQTSGMEEISEPSESDRTIKDLEKKSPV